MKLGNFVIRRSIIPGNEPNWFHDFLKYKDGTWQLGFFGWLMYTTNK